MDWIWSELGETGNRISNTARSVVTDVCNVLSHKTSEPICYKSPLCTCDHKHYHVPVEKSRYRTTCRPLRGGCSGTGEFPIFQSVFLYGDRGSGFRLKRDVQDFGKLRQKCLNEGVLFEDPQFPAADSSLFFSKSPPMYIEWKRPHELTSVPRLFVEGASRFDVIQGELGDCWLLVAVANLTLNDNLFFRVVPDDQSFVKDYAGIFHFRFWQYGRWVEIVVDDRLPTSHGELLFMHSKHRNEFWSALLEKAYAKLHGSYESLRGGAANEAMEDFTGGLTESYELNNPPNNLFSIMLKAYQRWSLMSCAINPDPNVTEKVKDNGLVMGHAYSITKVKLVEITTPRITGKIPLLRLRNPWGEGEWTGPWSDRSREWSLTSEDERKEIGLVFAKDGEFWISFKDFLDNFSYLEICNLNPDSLEDEPLTKLSSRKWEMSMFEGSWVRGCTAGGCRNFEDTFHMNPQYRVVLQDVDEDDDDNLCTMIVALMQKNRRSKRKLGMQCLTIGFIIYKITGDELYIKPLPKNYLLSHRSVATCDAYTNLREVSCRFKLEPGIYCIIPSTFDPGEEGEFVLRIFTEKPNIMTENDEDINLTEPDEQVKVDEESEEEKNKEQQLKNIFARLAGEDMEIDCKELQEILNFAFKREFDFEGFSLDVCRSMIAMVDIDRTGKLGLDEFRNLWLDIRMWKNVFKLYDKDLSGTLNTMELRAALNSAGYRLNFHILQALVLRYGKNGRITFDDFIMCAVKLKTMIEIFKERDPLNTGKATFALDEWVEKTMYS